MWAVQLVEFACLGFVLHENAVLSQTRTLFQLQGGGSVDAQKGLRVRLPLPRLARTRIGGLRCRVLSEVFERLSRVQV